MTDNEKIWNGRLDGMMFNFFFYPRGLTQQTLIEQLLYEKV